MGLGGQPQERIIVPEATRQPPGARSLTGGLPLRPSPRRAGGEGGERSRRWENNPRYWAGREGGSQGFGVVGHERLRHRGRRGRAIAGSIVISALTLSQASAYATESRVADFFRGREAGAPQPGTVGRRLATCSGDSDCQGSDADMEALENQGLAITCDPACGDTGSDVYGGAWCDFLGLTNCRACDIYNCAGFSGVCVPCNGEDPNTLGEITPAPAEPGSSPAPVSPGSSPSPVNAESPNSPIAIDADSCTTSACEDNADSSDNDYISDNSLTLYCDDKCADTPTDPYGGLWCNMRGLGQLCRACRADNCVGWTKSDTCLPCNELQTTTSPGATPAPSETEIPANTPAPSETQAPAPATPAPTETEAPVPATPAPSETSAPLPLTPAPSETSAPIDVTPGPSATESPVLTTPAPSETASPVDVTPSPETTTAPSATAAPAETSAPVGTLAPGATLAPDATASPAETMAPDATAAPGATPAPETTAAPGETTAPETTPAPDETMAPGATPAPGETVAPGATDAPGETMAPGATAAPGETLAPGATPAPEATAAPIITIAPGATLAPGATWAPNLTRELETVAPSSTMAPGATMAPAETIAPGTTVAPGATTAPGATLAPGVSVAPTAAPSMTVSAAPSAAPSLGPTASPSSAPTFGPTALPSSAPSSAPTAAPTAVPTAAASTVAPTTTSSTSATMTASLELAGVTGRTRNELQTDLEGGVTDAVSASDEGGNRTVNVVIDEVSSPEGTTVRRTRVRGRRRLQEDQCSLDDGDTCDVKATAKVVYERDVDTSGDGSARGVESISNKSNLQKIATSAGVEGADLRLGSLYVSADDSNQVLTGTNTAGVAGQTITTPEEADVSNYWVIIVAFILLLMLWTICLCWALQRYRRSADEQDDTFDMPPSNARWAADKHRAYTAKGGKPASRQDVDDAVVGDMIAQQQQHQPLSRDSGTASGATSEQLGLGQTLEEIPEEREGSYDQNSSEGSGRGASKISPSDAPAAVVAAGGGSAALGKGGVSSSGRQILSRGQHRSTGGSSTFSDELMSTQGDRSTQRGADLSGRSGGVSSSGLSGMSSGVSGAYSSGRSGMSSGLSGSFTTSSADITSGSFDDDESDKSSRSSDYEGADGGDSRGRTTPIPSEFAATSP